MIGEEQVQVNSDGTLTVSCKIPAKWLPLLQTICAVKGANMNDLLKMCLQFLIETARVTTEAPPDMKVLLHMMKVDSNWQSMFSYTTKAKLDIARVILVLQQSKDGKPREGFTLAMFDKPFVGDCRMNLCVDDIVEQVIEIAMGFSNYWDMREIVRHFDAKTVREALVRMVDAQTAINLDEADRDELPNMGNIAPNGKAPVYGNKAKGKHHRTPDSVANDKRYQQGRIVFDDNDRELADMEAGYKPEDWEGEHRDRGE
jgi:hypothetical protein